MIEKDTPLLDALDRFETALRAHVQSSAITDALYQCERLRLALRNSHAEGIRFAAFTIGRLLTRASPAVDDAVGRAHDALRRGLIDAGVRL